MMERSRLVRAATVLIIISAAVYLVSAVVRLWDFMGDLLMILFFAWLVGSMLIHVVNRLMLIPRMRRSIAILLVYLVLILLLATFAFLVLPSTASQISELVDDIPLIVGHIPGFLVTIEEFILRFRIEVDLVGQYDLVNFDDIVDDTTRNLSTNALAIAQGIASTLFAIGLVLILSFYIVIDGGRRLNEALKVLPSNWERETRMILHTFDATFNGYMGGLLIISLLYGVGTAIVMLSVGLPLPLPTAIVSSLLLAVPFLGDWLALALPLLIAASVGDFFTFIVVLAVLLFIQQIMLNLLTPRILGRAVRMPAILVIVAVVIGARLAGIPGALMGVPAAAVIYSLAVTYGTRIRARRKAREAEHLAGYSSSEQAEDVALESTPEAALEATPETPLATPLSAQLADTNSEDSTSPTPSAEPPAAVQQQRNPPLETAPGD